MQLSQRALVVEPFHAMAFTAQASALVDAGHDVIRLSLGEPDFGAPPAVREAMRHTMDGRPLTYTPALGLPALREAIADFYQQRHGVTVDPARVLVTSGASAALLVTLAATVDPGSEVIMADPSYPCNRALVDSFGGEVRLVPTTVESRYQLTAAGMIEAVTPRSSAVMLASPSNPTGTSIPQSEIARICSSAREQGLWRIADEIYLELADHDPDGKPAASVLAHDPGAIVISSFSKYFSMTGWRLGWAVLPDELVEPVERLAMNYFLCASAPAQIAAVECFTEETLEVCEERRLELLQRREIALTGLRRLGLPVPVIPTGAFYVYFDVSMTGMDSWTFCLRALDDVHVSLTPGRDFAEATADTHVRLSYAASREDLQEGLTRLAQILPASM
jgi:aspartate/methionine/tyrosine aminotransferase